jgi:cell filamentation protein
LGGAGPHLDRAEADHQEGYGHFCKRAGNPRSGRVRFTQGAGQGLHESQARRDHGLSRLRHPFLDGNGRTIMTVHSVLTQRAGFSIDWSATTKDAYLDALTEEIEDPSRGHLDAYLKPFMRDVIAYEHLATAIVRTPGLDGSVQDAELNEVLGASEEPTVKAQYEAMLAKRMKT